MKKKGSWIKRAISLRFLRGLLSWNLAVRIGKKSKPPSKVLRPISLKIHFNFILPFMKMLKSATKRLQKI